MNTPLRPAVLASLVLVALTMLRPLTAFAQPAAQRDACNQAMPDAIGTARIDAMAGGLTVTQDGCWIFVAVNVPPIVPGGAPPSARSGITVLRRSGGVVAPVHFHPLDRVPLGPVSLTHDDRVLIFRTGNRIVFFDVAKLTTGADDVELGAISDSHFSTFGGIAVSADDHYLFVGQAYSEWISVIDLQKARSSGFGPDAVVGGIPIAGNPFTLVLSPDGQFLYATGLPMAGSPGWVPDMPLRCDKSGPVRGFLIIDVLRATARPDASAVIAASGPACHALAIAFSPDGSTLYVTAPGDNTLMAFDTRPVRAGLAPRLIGRVPVGPLPRSVVPIDGGKRVLVSNAHHGSGDNVEPGGWSYITVIDAARVAEGAAAVVGSIPAGPAPESMTVTADGHTVLLTDASAADFTQSIQVIDLDRLTLRPAKP